MKNICIYLILFISLSSVQATTFSPLTIKTQIKQSDSIVKGRVISEFSEINENGEIVTVVDILADKWIGTEAQSDIIQVYYRGGVVGDKAVLIEGAPEFTVGEKVIVFTKKVHEKNYIVNLGLGKFSLKKLGDEYVLVNQIFPRKPQVGQMRLDKFIDLSQWVKKERFTERYKDKYEIMQEKQASIKTKVKKGRKIASIGKEENSEPKSATWLVFLFGLLGAVFIIIKKRES